MKRLFTIFLVVASLAVAGHFALMSVMPVVDHAAHGHEHQQTQSAAACPLGVVCLSVLASAADIPAAMAWVFASAVAAFAGYVILLSARFRPLVPIHVRTGTGFPELLSVFKRE
jgi:hypothetical protein